jgi:hypothetical protein
MTHQHGHIWWLGGIYSQLSLILRFLSKEFDYAISFQDNAAIRLHVSRLNAIYPEKSVRSGLKKTAVQSIHW